MYIFEELRPVRKVNLKEENNDMNVHREVKEQMLKELIEMMDDLENEGLKSKSPKLMKVETNSPEMAEKVVEAVESESEESRPEVEDKHSDTESEDDDERLKELYERLK